MKFKITATFKKIKFDEMQEGTLQ